MIFKSIVVTNTLIKSLNVIRLNQLCAADFSFAQLAKGKKSRP
jgi:hypothetical protein